MRRRLALTLLLGACDPRSEEPATTPQQPVTTPQAEGQSREANTEAQAEAVQLAPVEGSPTREELQDTMLMPPAFVEPAQLLRSLEEADLALRRFADYDEMPDEPLVLARYSDHELRGHDLRRLVTDTLNAMGARPEAPTLRTFTATDSMSYPRVLAVWQLPSAHKIVRIHSGNDNSGVTFMVGRGEFRAADYGLDNLRPTAPGAPLLESAGFLRDTKTIYPHIENYFVPARDAAPSAEGANRAQAPQR